MHCDSVRISVIVPVYNNPKDLRECLAALLADSSSSAEIIVVDDASTDGTVSVAREMGVGVLRLEKNSGPAAARNNGARHARGAILFFVDADVVIAPGAIARVAQFFADRLDVTAVFGSYDAYPRATGIVSRYRNLLHHFVHQNSNSEATTFWAGCGAIWRGPFDSVGGFDDRRYPKPSIEDIELGYRLHGAGYRIFLDKGLHGKHLKRWTLRSVVVTDVRNRAVPWARLILERNNSPKDLNLKLTQRFSGLLVLFACALGLIGMFQAEVLVFAVGVLLIVTALNRNLYAFFFRQHGLVFSTAGVLLHLVYFLYSGLSYLFVWAVHHFKKLGAANLKAIRGE